MIGLLIVAVVFAYIFLAKFIISKMKTNKAKNTALAILILIPTWDIILGYPIYKYLCWTQAGVHIYKTVDNVEGFYVGEKSLSSEPIKPYKGYKYIDYKQDGKYYRSYWADYFYDREVASMCVYPLRPYSEYAKIFKTGKCIVKKEIPESEVTGLWKISKKVFKNYSIFYLHITSVEVEVIDPRTKDKYFDAKDYLVDSSWMTAVNISNGKKSRMGCIGLLYPGGFVNYLFVINKITNFVKKEIEIKKGK